MARYLRTGSTVNSWCGYSWCRFGCGIQGPEIGSRDLSDGEWLWPEGLAHYVSVHSVRVPDEIIDRAFGPRTKDAALLSGLGKVDRREMDRTWWLRWAAERGACVVLDAGWSEMDIFETLAANRQLQDLGVTGISKGSAWQRRNDATTEMPSSCATTSA